MATDKDFRVKNGLVVAENISADGNISINGTSKIYVADSEIWDDGANFKLFGTNQTQYSALGQYGGHIFYTKDGGSNSTEVFKINHQGNITLGNNRDRTVSNSATAHDVAGKDLTISAGDTTAGTTDNIAGGDLILQGGQGKGTGAGGSITFQVADGGSTGSTLNSLSTAMTIADDGNVKIGTSSPEYELDVDGTIRILPTISSNTGTAIRIGAGGNSNDITLLRIDGAADPANQGESDSSQYGFSMKYMGSGSGDNNRYAMFMDDQQGTAIEAMSILQNGKVGINNDTPTATLDVTIVGSNTTTSGIAFGDSAGKGYLAAGSSYISFATDDGTTRIAIDNGGTNLGNVGIGTTTPTHKLEVNGSFAATTKSFDIEHPTKEGMRLHHGSLEGPEHGVYVRGRLEGVFSVIDLPDYWKGLVDEDSITVQLTPNGGFQQLYVEGITENKVYVKSQSDEPIDCFYFIQAERKDVDKMEVEY